MRKNQIYPYSDCGQNRTYAVLAKRTKNKVPTQASFLGETNPTQAASIDLVQ